MKKLLLLIAVFLLLNIVWSSCGKDSPSDPTPAPTTPTPTVVFPTGTFTATDSDGQWRLIFNADSSFTLAVNGVPVASVGRYIVSQNQIVLSDNSAPCVGSGDGTYKWAFNTPNLTFTVVSDNCVKRRNTQTSNTWRKQ
jgi:hypothetical protein